MNITGRIRKNTKNFAKDILDRSASAGKSAKKHVQSTLVSSRHKRHKDPYAIYGASRSRKTTAKMTYLQAVIILFAIGLLLLSTAFVRAVATNGTSGPEVAILVFASFLLAIAGIVLTFYGHSYIRVRTKLSWHLGLWLCVPLVAVNLLVIAVGIMP